MPPAFPITELHLPDWLREFEASLADRPCETVEARMAIAIEVSQLAAENDGGPFGALIYDPTANQILALGANLVVAGHCSIFHAELVAIMTAQLRCESHDLGGAGVELELASSCEPCTMCQGGILWSGVKILRSAALDEDARAIGFDEGPKAPDWQAYFAERGLKVEGGILREAAQKVLTDYQKASGEIYNPS